MTAADPPDLSETVGPADPVGDAGTEVAGLVARSLRDIADFPLPGIVFKDIVPLLADATAFAAVTRAFAGLANATGPVDLVAGVEARGFIFAAPLALELDCGLVPVRKVGKLPPPTLRRSYDLEYGSAEIELPTDIVTGRRVYVVDDVLATGGTLQAVVELITEAGGTVVGVGVLLELGFLAGRARAGLTGTQALLRI